MGVRGKGWLAALALAGLLAWGGALAAQSVPATDGQPAETPADTSAETPVEGPAGQPAPQPAATPGPKPAAEPLARLEKAQGTVHVLPEGSIRKQLAEAGQALGAGDQVMTLDDGRAVVVFRGGSRVVLDGNTKLRLKKDRSVGQSTGQAYYQVEKRGARGFEVKTGFAVIGVKGTRFLVREQGEGAEGGRAVAMREGRVGVQALKGQFELYQRKQRAAFERFKQQRRQEFEDFKQQQRAEFVGYVRSIELEGGRAVTFDGRKALSDEVSEELETDMDRLEQLL